MEDIDKALAFEIKKDIAERYFSFRKIIEQDSSSYLEAVLASSVELEAGIGLDLVRLYILLRDADLIGRFQRLTGLPDDVFYDPYVCTSSTIKNTIFSGLALRGFTRKGRFKNLFYDLYDRVRQATREFRATLEDLLEQHETINEQIKLFYRRNDLDTILSFIRSLDHDGGNGMLMNQAPSDRSKSSLSQKMKLDPPAAADELLPELPVIPKRADIRTELRHIVEETFTRQPDLEVRELV